ncbi:PorV/PorQ family protein [bacterium]|nr:PorV/PorQ family protein [bacterium]
MLNRLNTTLLLLALLLWAGSLSAAGGSGSGYNPANGLPDGFSEAGTRTAEFLTIPVGARGVALGGAFGALADDISALWWNPAGVAAITRPQVLLNVVDLPLDVRYTYTAGAAPLLDGKLVLGAFMGVLTSGDQEITTVTQPEGTGATFSTYSLQGGGSLAWNFSDRFAAGLNLKAVHEDIAGNTQSTFAFDLGTNYHARLAGREIRLAFLIRNLGGNMAFSGNSLKVELPAEEVYSGGGVGRQERKALRQATRFKLPTSFDVSLSYVLAQGDNYTWAGAAEFAQNSDMPVSYHLGSELTRKLGKTTASLRGGWEFRGDELGLEGSDRLRGLSAGGGILYDFLAFHGSIDYAWRNWGRLSASHLFSLGIGF